MWNVARRPPLAPTAPAHRPLHHQQQKTARIGVPADGPIMTLHDQPPYAVPLLGAPTPPANAPLHHPTTPPPPPSKPPAPTPAHAPLTAPPPPTPLRRPATSTPPPPPVLGCGPPMTILRTSVPAPLRYRDAPPPTQSPARPWPPTSPAVPAPTPPNQPTPQPATNQPPHPSAPVPTTRRMLLSYEQVYERGMTKSGPLLSVSVSNVGISHSDSSMGAGNPRGGVVRRCTQHRSLVGDHAPRRLGHQP